MADIFINHIIRFFFPLLLSVLSRQSAARVTLHGLLPERHHQHERNAVPRRGAVRRPALALAPPSGAQHGRPGLLRRHLRRGRDGQPHGAVGLRAHHQEEELRHGVHDQRDRGGPHPDLPAPAGCWHPGVHLL